MQTTMNKIFLSLLVLSVFSSCKGDLALTDMPDTDPVFNINAQLDNQPIQLVAGQNGNYMKTFILPTDSAATIIYGAYLGKEGTYISAPTPDNPSIKMEYRGPETKFSVNNLPQPGVYTLSQTGSSWSVNGLSISLGGELINPNANEPNMSMLLNGLPIQADEPLNMALGLNSFQLTYSDNDGCICQAMGSCLVENLTSYSTQDILPVYLDFQKIEASEGVLQANVSGGAPPYTFEWDSNGVATQPPISTPNYHIYNEGNYHLKVIDQLGHEAEASININFNNNGELCGANFLYQLQEISTVIVEPGTYNNAWNVTVIDIDGHVWRTDLAEQDQTSLFEILSSERYLDNEDGIATAKTSIRLYAFMSDGQGQTKRFETDDMTIAIPLMQ
jgi:hypothetical protein